MQSQDQRIPATPLEHELCHIFAEVLSRTEVHADDSFFDMGGDSLQAIKVMHRINKETGIKTPVSAIFSQQTAAALAKRITDAMATLPSS